MFKRRFQHGLCWNQAKYPKITITHVYFIALICVGSLGRCLTTRPSGLVFKQLPWDPANVNAWKNMCDPYNVLHQNGLEKMSTISTISLGYDCGIFWSHLLFFRESWNNALTLNAPIATKVVCFSCLLKCLRSLYGKQCGPRSDCSYRSSMFWIHAVCFYT